MAPLPEKDEDQTELVTALEGRRDLRCVAATCCVAGDADPALRFYLAARRRRTARTVTAKSPVPIITSEAGSGTNDDTVVEPAICVCRPLNPPAAKLTMVSFVSGKRQTAVENHGIGVGAAAPQAEIQGQLLARYVCAVQRRVCVGKALESVRVRASREQVGVRTRTVQDVAPPVGKLKPLSETRISSVCTVVVLIVSVARILITADRGVGDALLSDYAVSPVIVMSPLGLASRYTKAAGRTTRWSANSGRSPSPCCHLR